MISSFPVALPWAARHATTILHMTHASQELGNALADVLFGDANPGGRLAQTWPASLEQLPPMMDYDLRHGRTYMYSQAEPQYAFGYGLSYTSFAYGNLRTSAETAPLWRHARRQRRRHEHRSARRRRGRATLRPLPRIEGRPATQAAARLPAHHGGTG